MSGTPGTGKSSAAAALSPALRVIEVGQLAVEAGCGRKVRSAVLVDLPRLQRAFPRWHRAHPRDLYVGHLAHLLPLEDVIVLRCHPTELALRLDRRRQGTPADRRANVVAESIDLVTCEAVALDRRVWEIDTSGRSPTVVARAVLERWRRRGPPRVEQVDWLSDPAVTDYLLDPLP